MKTIKICPQCGTPFMGRSNQLYCTEPCKVKAFRAGKTRQADSAMTTTSQPPAEASAKPDSHKLLRTTAQGNTNKSSKMDLELRRLEFDHERQLRQMEFDEAQRQRTHEQTLVQIKAEEKQQEDQLQRLSKQVEELQLKTVPPLTEWDHYPIGIRRRYGSLVKSILTTTNEPLDTRMCREWLDEYRPFYQEVNKFCKKQGLPIQARRPFIFLEELAKLIEAYRWEAFSDSKQLELPPVLLQQLVQAC